MCVQVLVFLVQIAHLAWLWLFLITWFIFYSVYMYVASASRAHACVYSSTHVCVQAHVCVFEYLRAHLNYS